MEEGSRTPHHGGHWLVLVCTGVTITILLYCVIALFKLFNDWQSSGYCLPKDLCAKEMEGKAMMMGNMGGSERMLSGLGVMPDMVHSTPGQNMQGFDFTDEEGTFHTFSPHSGGKMMGVSAHMGGSTYYGQNTGCKKYFIMAQHLPAPYPQVPWEWHQLWEEPWHHL